MLKGMTIGLLALMALAAGTAGAHALTVKFDENNMGFGSGPIIVESDNGTSWTTIKPSPLSLPFAIFVGHNENDFGLRYYQVLQSNTPIYASGEFITAPNPYMDTEVSTPGLASTDNFDSITRTNILHACNSRLQAGASIHDDQNMFFEVPLTLVATFSPKHGADFNRIAYGHSRVPLVCKGVPRPGPQRTPPLTVSGIELFLSTYQNHTTRPNPATVCKKGRILVRVSTSRPGPVKFRLWTKVGDAPMQDEVIDAVSTAKNEFTFNAEYTKWVSVSKTSYVQAKVEEMVNPIGLTDGWKDITLQCSDIGGGVTTAPKPQSNSRPAVLVAPVPPRVPLIPQITIAPRPQIKVAPPAQTAPKRVLPLATPLRAEPPARKPTTSAAPRRLQLRR